MPASCARAKWYFRIFNTIADLPDRTVSAGWYRFGVATCGYRFLKSDGPLSGFAIVAKLFYCFLHPFLRKLSRFVLQKVTV